MNAMWSPPPGRPDVPGVAGKTVAPKSAAAASAEHLDVPGAAGARLAKTGQPDGERGAMEMEEPSMPGNHRVTAGRKGRVLVIGPAPYREGGNRVTFELTLEYIAGLPLSAVHHFDLPVHRPLYDESGGPGRLSHPRTVIDVLRAVSLVPRVDNVVFFGSSNVCFSYGLVFMLCAKLFRKRCAVRITGGRAVLATRLLPAFVRSACLFMARAADVFLVQTEVARDDLPPRLRSKAVVVRGFRPRPPPGPPPVRRREGAMSFACVTRAKPNGRRPEAEEKGLDVLLDAVELVRASFARQSGPASMEGTALHVYGPVSADLVERMRNRPDVILHGFMPNDRFRGALRQHDALVFPSRYFFDGHPGAIIEAFMAGLPVIASDLPGPCEIVRHEVNGLVVRTGDANALAVAMIRLSSDGALRRRLAAGARASASDFDQDKVLPELVRALGLP